MIEQEIPELTERPFLTLKIVAKFSSPFPLLPPVEIEFAPIRVIRVKALFRIRVHPWLKTFRRYRP